MFYHNMLKTAHKVGYTESILYESMVKHMTTVAKRLKNKAGKNTGISDIREYIIVAIYAVAGILSCRSSWCDIALPSLSMVLAYSTRDVLYKYSVIIGSLLSCGLLAVKDTAYIPYFLALMLYAVATRFMINSRHSLIWALAVLVTSKIILVNFYMPMYTKLLSIIEALAVYVVSDIVNQGATSDIRRNPKSFTDCSICIITLLCVVLVFSGGDSHWIYPGFAIALSAGWYFIAQGKIALSFVGLLVSAISLADKRGFAVLLLCTAVLWMVGGFFSEKMSVGVYPVVVGGAIVGNIVFISQLNSFALTGSCVLALIIYFCAPYLLEAEKVQPLPDLTAGRDWRLLIASLKKLENTLSFLASCVIDISRLNEKNLKTENLEDIVADDVCKNCEKNTVCWQQKYSFTQQQFTEYAQRVYWREENRFPTSFANQCINTGKLIKSFEENSRLLLSKKYILQSQKNNQKLLQKAFVSMSGVVSDIIYKNQHSYLLNTTLTMETDRFLKELQIGHTYCLCSQNPDQMTFAVFDPLDDKMLYKIQCHAEKIYSTKFLPATVEKQGTEWLYIFTARPLYSYETAVETSRYKRVNGDTWDVFSYNGYLYVLLSDGMGTGNMAAAESQTVISMTKSLITTGVSMITTIDLINLSMNLKGNGETSASLDILCVDLFSGQCNITKAGAGVSITLDKKGVNRHYQDSLPLGIVKEVKSVQCDFSVQAGDTIIMMSDGVGVVSADIQNLYGKSCSEIAQTILNCNVTDDDKTVIAVKLKIDI